MELAKTKLRTEIEILTLRAEKYETEMRTYDTEIMVEIGKTPNVEIGDKLKLLWTKDFSKQEQISNTVWEKQDLWFAKLPDNPDSEKKGPETWTKKPGNPNGNGKKDQRRNTQNNHGHNQGNQPIFSRGQQGNQSGRGHRGNE